MINQKRMLGKFRIKKQVDGCGFFGEVEISVERANTDEIIFKK